MIHILLFPLSGRGHGRHLAATEPESYEGQVTVHELIVTDGEASTAVCDGSSATDSALFQPAVGTGGGQEQRLVGVVYLYFMWSHMVAFGPF